MNCERFQALLMDYLDKELPAEDMAEMESHEASCPDCRAEAQEMRLLLTDLRHLDDDVEVPAELSRSWRVEIRKEEDMKQEKESRGKKGFLRTFRPAIAIAASVLFLIGGTALTRDSLPKANTTAAQQTSASQGKRDGGTVNRSNEPDLMTAPNASPMYAMEEEGTYMAMDSSYGSIPESAAAGGGASTGSAEATAPKIIRTYTYTLATQAFDADLETLKTLCEQVGGWVEYSSLSGDATKGETRSASLTLRIPTAHMDKMKPSIEGVGRVVSSYETAEDVTENYTDTSIRLQTQRDKMTRLQKLMETAGDLGDLLAVESEIADTQYQIDRLESSLRNMDRRVEYTSVQVYLREEKVEDLITQADLTLGERIRIGIDSSLKSIGAFLQDMAVFLVMALPVLIPLAVILIIVVIVTKRRRNKHTKQ